MTLYCRAHDAEEVITLLAHAMRQWHRPLADAKVQLGVLWATADDDGPALKRNGYPVLGTVRVLALKWRVLTQLDALLEIDERAYQDLDDPSRLAFCDHELSHLELVTEPDSDRVKLDAISRPKLRAAKGDVDAGDGFLAVIRRHGEAAVEFRNWRRAWGYARAAAETHDSEADDAEDREEAEAG